MRILYLLSFINVTVLAELLTCFGGRTFCCTPAAGDSGSTKNQCVFCEFILLMLPNRTSSCFV